MCPVLCGHFRIFHWRGDAVWVRPHGVHGWRSKWFLPSCLMADLGSSIIISPILLAFVQTSLPLTQRVSVLASSGDSDCWCIYFKSDNYVRLLAYFYHVPGRALIDFVVAVLLGDFTSAWSLYDRSTSSVDGHKRVHSIAASRTIAWTQISREGEARDVVWQGDVTVMSPPQ